MFTILVISERVDIVYFLDLTNVGQIIYDHIVNGQNTSFKNRRVDRREQIIKFSSENFMQWLK